MGCGQSRNTDGYVINGFYMSMREKFVAKDASIYYMMVEWDEKELSWEDFRGKVLGATDPETATAGSLRKTIFDKYQDLGLKSEPNVGDNGVHASASPFEGLCERLNWGGVKLGDDEFGKAILEAGVDEKTVMSWTKDPQVVHDGKGASLFDTFEDKDASQCLTLAKDIVKAEEGKVNVGVKNAAFVFIKPHANVEAVQKLVKEKFEEVKITITKEGTIEGAEIDKKLLIDNHYYAIANKAKLTQPKDLVVPESGKKKFEDAFGLKWEDALKGQLVLNAAEACKKYKLDANELNERWAKAKKDKKIIKFGGGFYCAKVFEAVAPKATTEKAEKKKAEEAKKAPEEAKKAPEEAKKAPEEAKEEAKKAPEEAKEEAKEEDKEAPAEKPAVEAGAAAPVAEGEK